MSVGAERATTPDHGVSRARVDLASQDGKVIMKDRTTPSKERLRATVPVAMLAFTAVTLGAAIGCGVTASTPDGSERPVTAGAAASKAPTSLALVEEGQRVFRLETFGDEQL